MSGRRAEALTPSPISPGLIIGGTPGKCKGHFHIFVFAGQPINNRIGHPIIREYTSIRRVVAFDREIISNVSSEDLVASDRCNVFRPDER
jgi:hypothetical protein